LLTAISVERCISVLFPLWYRCQRPKHSAGITCGVLLVLAGLLISLIYLSISFAPSYLTASAGIAIAFSLILLSIMLISDLFFFLKLLCGTRKRHPGRLFFAVLLNVIIFFAFAFDNPSSVEVFLDLTASPELFPEISMLLLMSLNSSINPIIYILVGSCQKCWLQCSVTGALRRMFEEK
ncbi:Mas-related G-protein coupled receptor member H, partial [Merops nubicus]